MKFSNLAVAAAATAPLAAAVNLAPRSDSPKVVGSSIARRQITNPLTRDRARLAKRQKTVTGSLDNQQTLYYANLTVGTPGQSIELSLDTGSSDMWVNTASSSLCRQAQNACQGGTYSQSSSSSAKVVNNEFNISYVDGSGASGDYISDTVVFGGTTLDSFQFGVADTSSSYQGVLGIGYAINEVQVNRAQGNPYPNLPLALVDDGAINNAAYSLWLNDLDASTGQILFGGVDEAKYEGDLVTLPILKEGDFYVELIVALSGVSFNGDAMGSSSDLPIAALLDSGTSLIYLPDAIVENIYNKVDVVTQQGTPYAYCDLANEQSTLSFTFSGKTINVPMNELLIDAGTDQFGRPITFENGRTACIFGVASSGGSTPLLGDTFLRSAYVVYDLENNEISIAQTDFNSTESNIREITNGTSVPGAVAASTTISSVLNIATDGARLGGASSTGSLTGSPNAASPSGASVHIAAVFSVAAFAVGFAAMLL